MLKDCFVLFLLVWNDTCLHKMSRNRKVWRRKMERDFVSNALNILNITDAHTPTCMHTYIYTLAR